MHTFNYNDEICIRNVCKICALLEILSITGWCLLLAFQLGRGSALVPFPLSTKSPTHVKAI